jgi:hypothetical protein
VAQLRSQAEARHLSVEALALQILGEAVAHGDDEEWRACNQRRIELIRQPCRDGLRADEEDEWQPLQDMADQDVERLDARMLDDVNHLDRQAHRMVDASSG